MKFSCSCFLLQLLTFVIAPLDVYLFVYYCNLDDKIDFDNCVTGRGISRRPVFQTFAWRQCKQPETSNCEIVH